MKRAQARIAAVPWVLMALASDAPRKFDGMGMAGSPHVNHKAKEDFGNPKRSKGMAIISADFEWQMNCSQLSKLQSHIMLTAMLMDYQGHRLASAKP